ncbi:cysteine proteinase [Mycena galericulata]|nr:cysteine proteinase [Mycena galericulata]
MNLRSHKRRATEVNADKEAEASKAFFTQQEKHAGLLVTNELEKALVDCKALVERIAKDCRSKNRRFRDVEFDLENDKERCLFGLSKEKDERYAPSGVERLSKIFNNKFSFFIDGADSGDIVQGGLGDCWFLSALSTMSTAKGLIEKFCVARDEQVGVYGWIFFRDAGWVTVIIDDLLFTSIPKFEELTDMEQLLYHRDKKLYNASVRTGGKSLYFARSGTEGETWVPLIEKAYAKLHGDYASISGGYSCEAIEDLTGGVSTFIPAKDILDPDVFWRDELLRATQDRLFGCGFDTLDSSRSGNAERTVNGLIGGHAYSVLRAVEFRGRRFVVLRNPWGDSEWTGPWSDGSREWTEEWLPALKELQHTFGDDGQFVMEYSDFLDNWELLEKTLLFDDSWVMSSQWLQVNARAPTAAWSYGDISFTISLPARTKTVLVLSQLDDRYFRDISGDSSWMFDFVLFKKGKKDVVAESGLARFYMRSVNVELELEAGEYVVHVRLDRCVNDYEVHPPSQYEARKFARVQTERAKSQSIASNYKPSAALKNLPIPLDVLAGQDLTEFQTKEVEAEKQLKVQEAAHKKASAKSDLEGRAPEKEKVQEISTTTETTTTMTTVAVVQKKMVTNEGRPTMTSKESVPDSGDEENSETEEGDEDEPIWHDADEVDLDNMPTYIADEDLGLRSNAGSPVDEHDAMAKGSGSDDSDPYRPPDHYVPSEYHNDMVVLGLRVYTQKEAPAVVGGQLRHEMKSSDAPLILQPPFLSAPPPFIY